MSLEDGLGNKWSCLAPTLGVNKFINVTDESLIVVVLKSDLDFQQTHQISLAQKVNKFGSPIMQLWSMLQNFLRP
jgi:hypothetical protein